MLHFNQTFFSSFYNTLEARNINCNSCLCWKGPWTILGKRNWPPDQVIISEYIGISGLLYVSKYQRGQITKNKSDANCTYWSRTMASSAWVWARARRRARSLASDLDDNKTTSHIKTNMTSYSCKQKPVTTKTSTHKHSVSHIHASTHRQQHLTIQSPF